MLSRVADAIHWMSRYVERAENVARFADVHLLLALDLPLGEEESWAPIVATTGDDAFFYERCGAATREAVLRFLTFDAAYPNSILRCLRAARENARQVRPALSSETWEHLNTSYLFVRDAEPESVLDAPSAFFARVRRNSHTFTGLMEETMSHDEALHFARLGRTLERADKTSRILDVKYYLLPEEGRYDHLRASDELHWGALLTSASALAMYRRTVGPIAPTRVVRFLLQQRDFPRSLLFCLAEAERSLRKLTGTPYRETAVERRLGRLRAMVEFAEVEAILEDGLHPFLDEVQRELNAVAGLLHAQFFSLPTAAGGRG